MGTERGEGWLTKADELRPGFSVTDAIAAEVFRLTGTKIRAEEAAMLMQRALNGGIVPFIKRLGATGNQETNQVIVYPQLRVLGRKFHGKLTLS